VGGRVVSLAAMSWVWAMSDLDPTEKLVLLALADCHNESTGRCFPARETLAVRACVSVESVRRWLRKLEERGLIETVVAFDEHGRQRSNEYELSFDESSPVTTAPLAGEGGTPTPVRGREGHTGEGAANRKRRTGSKNTDSGGGRRRLRTVNGRVVEATELELAHDVLETWNRLTDQRLSATSWVRMVLKRVDENPELGLDDHERVIEAALADPWWRGRPSPNVVYGSDAQFERSLLAAEAYAEKAGEVDRMRDLVARTRRVA